jgi:biotin carboxyl carrier protein
VRSRKRLLSAVAIVVILPVCVFASYELTLPHDGEVLNNRPSPELAGITQLYVVVLSPNAEGNGFLKELEKEAEGKLTEAGIEVPPTIYVGARFKAAGVPELRIYVNMLKVNGSELCVFHVQSSLATRVSLAQRPEVDLSADIWRIGSELRETAAQSMQEAVKAAANEQIEAFIAAWQKANAAGAVSTQSKPQVAAPTPLKEQAKPRVQAQTGEGGYVASKNSGVFHKPDCSSAKRISSENLVRYATRGEAIAAGKRPCQRCNP